MDENTRTALHHSQVIDLTTTGRRTGRPRRIEIFLHEEEGRLFISGMPRADRTRDWIHNITADPHSMRRRPSCAVGRSALAYQSC